MDAKLRELERAASQGDADAQARLMHAKEQAGMALSLEELEQKKEEFAEIGERAFEKLFKDFFAKYGKYCESITWQQYTPDYCDGDQCSFYYHSFLDGAGGTTFTEYAISIGYDPYDTYRGPQADAGKGPSHDEESKAFWMALNAIDDLLTEKQDLLYDVFGDHAEIFVCSEGLDVNEYKDHD